MEAGNRLGTLESPEEVNRIVTDHVSSLHLVCTPSGVEFLRREGFQDSVVLVGDPMYDAFCYYTRQLDGSELAGIVDFQGAPLEVPAKFYYLTCHRQENTDTDEKRLKFLFAWLSKNQRRIIGYSEEFYNNTTKVLDAYLKNPENQEAFALLHDLKQEVMSKYAYIRQARTVRYLEDIVARNYKGERLTYGRMLLEAIELLRDLKFELGNYFEPLMLSVLHYMEMILDDRYLLRRYINCPDDKLSKGGVEIRKNYRRLVSLRDEFESVRKSRQKPVAEG